MPLNLPLPMAPLSLNVHQRNELFMPELIFPSLIYLDKEEYREKRVSPAGFKLTKAVPKAKECRCFFTVLTSRLIVTRNPFHEWVNVRFIQSVTLYLIRAVFAHIGPSTRTYNFYEIDKCVRVGLV